MWWPAGKYLSCHLHPDMVKQGGGHCAGPATKSRSSWLTLVVGPNTIWANSSRENLSEFWWFWLNHFIPTWKSTSHTRPPPLLTVSGLTLPQCVMCHAPRAHTWPGAWPWPRVGRSTRHTHTSGSARHEGKNRFRGLEKCLAGMWTLWRSSSVNTADCCSIRSIPQQLVKVYATTCNIGPSGRESHCDEWL